MAKDDAGLRRDDAGIWHIDVTVKGRRIQRSAGTADREAAREYRDKIRADLWREAHLGARPQVTWDKAVVAFLRLKEGEGKRDVANDHDKARLFTAKLAGKRLDAITVADLEEVLDEQAHWSVATRNRHIAFVTSVFRMAVAKGWLDTYPRPTKGKEPKGRVRWITREEAETLMRELPEHLSRMARFSLATGLRQSNVSHLSWRPYVDRKEYPHVDLLNRRVIVPASCFKNGRDFSAPLNSEAMAVLSQQRALDEHWVFAYDGHPIMQPAGAAWFKALKRAGITDFRWHDLRHTWASWHAMAGTPLEVIQKLGGWETLSMVQRYAHLCPHYVDRYAENVMPAGPALAVVNE